MHPPTHATQRTTGPTLAPRPRRVTSRTDAAVGEHGRGRIPEARGEVSAHVLAVLSGDAGPGDPAPSTSGDPLDDEDSTLALYVLQELCYRGFVGVDDELEWDLDLLRLRTTLEARFIGRVLDEVGPVGPVTDVRESLLELFRAPPSRSLAGWCATEGDHLHLREQAVHRSPYQLKEADPHTWALPRLHGEAKAALVEIQADEYGQGDPHKAHAALFALHMRRLGLDDRYGAYLDLVPASTLATSNLVTTFGLHRRWRGALVGHLALFEMASVPVMASYSAALRRLGYDAWTRLFYDVHVTADAEHQTVALERLAGGLVAAEPHLADDVMFGARALGLLEARVTTQVLDAWDAGRTSLRGPVPAPADVPGLHEHRLPGDDPRTEAATDRVAPHDAAPTTRPRRVDAAA